MSTVSLLDYAPLERFDGKPWMRATIQEAATGDGAWTDIETFQLDPLDSDPRNPAARDFTSENATLDQGWYRIVWRDEDENASITPPVHNDFQPANYQPTVTDVAALIRSRTRDPYNNELGTFTADTRPTYQQVLSLIEQAVRRVAGRIGYEMPDPLIGDARDVAALRAAMLVELSFWGDQITVSRGPYQELKLLYTEALQELLAVHEELAAAAGADDITAPAGVAIGSFPPVGPVFHVPGTEIAPDALPDWLIW